MVSALTKVMKLITFCREGGAPVVTLEQGCCGVWYVQVEDHSVMVWCVQGEDHSVWWCGVCRWRKVALRGAVM